MTIEDKDAELKLRIGNNIRGARLNQHMTQADVCGDESELTIRQLARIENGQVLVSLSKLMFLSQRLNYPIEDIIDVDKIEIPKRYLELKNKIIRYHTYGDEERIGLLEDMFDEIYEHFYDHLPEEEQLLVEVLQVQLDVFTSRNITYGLSLLEEYFQQILKKKQYSYNDLLIINLYFLCCATGLEDKTYFEELSKKVLLYIDYSDNDRIYILERILIGILIQVKTEDYLIYTKVLREITESTNNFQHKPAIYAFETKYYLKVEESYEKAEQSYNKAIEFAKMLNDQVLVNNLTKEKERDLGGKESTV
ncbi:MULTISPECIES: helix-turn-helix domain-containing protein [Streptococcus]|uniref:Transcription activator plcR n=1 Tax=Streptococcus viridans TaxID=78535 RepID=A0A447Z2N4_9STRE|nr:MULTISPECIES: XRE family transcriptional regulator [Streptococcus]VED66540.1 transcription activator plcR [Streptococcus viridans]VEE18604.1 transcription activator plcR [Streptococcus australis]